MESYQLKLPDTITATFDVLTPMFIGDGQQNPTMIFPQSIKGALRFWWRALQWSRCIKEKSDPKEALRLLHSEEARLFGNISGEAKTHQAASIAIHSISTSLTHTEKKKIHQELKKREAARYLGYGVVESFTNAEQTSIQGRLTRGCINHNQSFEVIFSSSKEEDLKAIIPAIKLLGLLGGLGAKARKGFGSIQLASLRGQENWTFPKSLEDYQKTLAQLLEGITTKALPPFTAFSKQSLIITTDFADNAFSVLENYGKAMMCYRSWGRKPRNKDEHIVLGELSEKNFPQDHDWSKGETVFKRHFPKWDFKSFHPKRAIFGLPHSYGKYIHVGRVLKEKSRNEKVGRRASPLFFHVCKLDNCYLGIALLLPAQFLPAKEKVSANGLLVAQQFDWSVLKENFLLDTNRFPQSTIVFPSVGASA
ncbi:type III-B CRISPR module RAMP protein Cmr1 [Suttonella ornithocola]|uniref:CRISPR type III-B/RAMP module RAMP protein Cmr1 n=1 Tax=Suttonella ornithocola TaxID=279832 RepID=A0A380MZC1_9GAMM|nr:type III-B CRISPR module RAMP protein Cmr1 [Suttonella ornithocola]SUO97031.1 CRISPR type III-B/RAMP module RAMP protein Cmr1 [Suttonella ornithocola]